jgi:hypothetical protein
VFAFLRNARRAKQAANSLAQLIQMLSAGYETMGPDSPERLLLGLGNKLGEDTGASARLLRVSVPILPDEDFPVFLEIGPGERRSPPHQRQPYVPWLLAQLQLPHGAPVIGLEGGATYKVTHQARLLYVAYRKSPNVTPAPDISGGAGG